MAAAAIPILTKVAPFAASAVAGLFGRKASGATKEQKAAQDQTMASQKQLTGAAAPLFGQGAQLNQQGGQYLGDAGRYYQGILGSRQQAASSLAPEMNTALEYYRGAEGKTRRTMTGGSRDTALAELDRQKVGQLAGMLPAARRSAAEGITGVGGTALQGGTALTGQGAGLLDTGARIGAQNFANATTLRNQAEQGGKSWGSTIFDIVKGGIGSKGGNKGIGGGGVYGTGSIYPPVSPG